MPLLSLFHSIDTSVCLHSRSRAHMVRDFQVIGLEISYSHCQIELINGTEFRNNACGFNFLLNCLHLGIVAHEVFHTFALVEAKYGYFNWKHIKSRAMVRIWCCPMAILSRGYLWQSQFGFKWKTLHLESWINRLNNDNNNDGGGVAIKRYNFWLCQELMNCE